MDRRNFIKTIALAGGAMVVAPSILSTNVFGSSAIQIRPQWAKKTSAFKHTWSGLGNVDQMRWIPRRDMQEQLAMCHKEIGLRHVRAVGIFDDEMWVYDKDPANYLNKEKRSTRRYNWRVPYYIYDSLVSMGIAPVVSTCFTPSGMKTGNETCFDTHSNVTPPKDWKEWGNFVNTFVKGLVDRYGIEIVRSWYFEVWNEPNLGGFWTGGMDGYFKMYQIVYNAIKSVDPSLKVGGPSTAHTVWLSELLNFSVKNNCMPDYIIGHIYNNDSAGGDPLSPFDGPKGDKENKSPNFVSGITRGARKLLDQASFKGEFHMNEWGLSWHPFAPVRETANEAAFILKTMSEVSQLADYFAYWCISDIYNQVGYGKEAFHGNYGMISLDGLRKPNYFAHQLLSRLGTERVETTGNSLDELTNAIATKTKDGVQVAVYGFVNEYTPGDATSKKVITVLLPDTINPESVKLFKIDSVNNNILADWKEMGSPDYLKPKEKEILLAKNEFTASSDNPKTTKNSGGFEVTFQMEMPGTVLVEAKFL